jgi:hypothetical protein
LAASACVVVLRTPGGFEFVLDIIIIGAGHPKSRPRPVRLVV